MPSARSATAARRLAAAASGGQHEPRTRKAALYAIAALTGLAVSVAGNVGHIQAGPGQPVILADRLTAATSPPAAAAALATSTKRRGRGESPEKRAIAIFPASCVASLAKAPIRGERGVNGESAELENPQSGKCLIEGQDRRLGFLCDACFSGGALPSRR